MINIHKSKSSVWMSRITKIKVNCRNQQKKLTKLPKILPRSSLNVQKSPAHVKDICLLGLNVITFITVSNIPMISSKYV